jgi:hypothetical protein
MNFSYYTMINLAEQIRHDREVEASNERLIRKAMRAFTGRQKATHTNTNIKTSALTTA